MKKLLILLIPLSHASCNNQGSTVKDTSVQITQGRLIYSISGEGTTSGWDLEVVFDQNNVRINEEYALTAKKTYIYDKKQNEILGLIDDFKLNRRFKDCYFIYYTSEELIDLALSSNYGDTSITTTQEFKEILGYNCQKSIIKHGNQVEVEVWTTDKIKPGILYPWTPLTFENVALEYEIKILGKVDRRYVIKSISDQSISQKNFEHQVPDEYNLVVPVSVFSLDSMWAKDYEENHFKSFQYPTFQAGRNSVKKYIRDALKDILPGEKQTDITLEFVVSKEGKLIDIVIDYGRERNYTESVKTMLEEMPKWVPAKVKGEAVNSEVTIFI
ncbi:MAG: hypothetical protein CL840_21180 [Crocinitomicaceae bacterium]|nr:hypothetical protein [Crocinitomicaceae bacterium]|tara:strand:- start:6476 stop:7462 length:987 start_codon:yes stop_codon:yes gene_type:complete